MRIGIDLGGTKTEGIVMDRAGRIATRERRPTPAKAGYDAVVEMLCTLILDLERSAGVPCRVGIGTPGAVSTRTGRMKNANTVCLNDRPLLDDLQRHLGRELRLENDANCFALSEAVDGAARGQAVVFGIIMGTGVGGGMVIDRRIRRGLQHIAGEWGHNVLEPSGPLCYCGRRGCVEMFLSGPGFARDYATDAAAGHLDPAAIVAAAKRGDRVAQQALTRFLDRFGRALATVINILDPDVVVLGGGLSRIGALYDRGAECVARYVFNDELRTPIVPNCHGDSSGVRGAAWLWPA